MDYIRRGAIREPKVVPIRDYQWTAEARGRFLDHLAATCNVREACRAAGRHHTGVYALRRRDPVFAEEWQAALEAGYDTLEAALLEHSITPLYAEDEDGPEPVGGGSGSSGVFDPEQAMKLLNHHRTMQGRGARPAKRGGPRVDRATTEETNAAILAALARLDARQPKKRAKGQAAAKGKHAVQTRASTGSARTGVGDSSAGAAAAKPKRQSKPRQPRS